MTQGGISSSLETKKQTQRNPGQKHLLIGVTDPRRGGADFSGNLALKSALHVQSTALNDVNCSCECSALLQIKPHDFKHIINGHLGKVESIGLAQHHTEILWLHQRQNPVFYNGVRLGKKDRSYTSWNCLFQSSTQPFFPRATEAGIPQGMSMTTAQTDRQSYRG